MLKFEYKINKNQLLSGARLKDLCYIQTINSLNLRKSFAIIKAIKMNIVFSGKRAF